ncbi:NusG domain II-containing protein [Ruoffia tabacinasalis]|uniref:NusG domain II-containing protein n=1 Tax=Ruoffia tabacinasalis TaxID=87458 RepID=UPI0030D38ABF
MRKILSYFKPFDYIFIIVSIIISFIPNVITNAHFNDSGDAVAIVKIHGEVVDEFPLSEGLEVEKTYYPNDNQYNIIEINNNQARIKEDNSPDQVGVRTGWIERPGQTAICLPHGLVLEITGQMAEDELVLPL